MSDQPLIDARPDHLDIVRAILRRHVPERKVWAFGSRVTWTARTYSDLDLVILGDEPLDLGMLASLKEDFSESDLPWKVDVVDWADTSGSFRKIIRKNKVEFLLGGKMQQMSNDLRLGDHWNKTTVFKLAGWKNGLAFKNINFTPDGRPVIKIAELKSGITDQTKFTDVEYGQDVFVREGDMLFSWSGNPDTSIDVFRWKGPEGWLNQHIYKVTPSQGVDEDFLFFLLRWLRPRFVEIARNKQTTGLGHVTLQDFKTMSVGLPDPPEQKTIIAFVKPLDDQIDLNRRMNETLEEMARALFRDWFVDFGPTRAKMEGREPYLTQEIWDQFPDKLDDEGKPDVWEKGTLGDVADSPRTGVDPSEIDSETPYIGLEHMPRKSIALSEWAGAGKVSSSKSAFKKGDFLFGKLRPYFHKVGTAPVNGICSTDIVVVRPKEETWRAFVISCISTGDFVAYTDQTSTGTKMPRASWKTMGKYELCLPSKPVVHAFQNMVQPMIDRIVANIHESRTLAQTRDLLLPKFMSDEIRVRDAEKAVEAVA